MESENEIEKPHLTSGEKDKLIKITNLKRKIYILHIIEIVKLYYYYIDIIINYCWLWYVFCDSFYTNYHLTMFYTVMFCWLL